MSLELPRARSTTKSPKSATSKPGLDTPLQYLPGIGPRRAALLRRKGLETLGDALYYFPFRFEDRRKIFTPRELNAMPEGSLVCVAAQILAVREIPRRGAKGTIVEMMAEGEDGSTLHCTWFHAYKGLAERMRGLQKVVLTGNIKYFRGRPGLVHPDVDAALSPTSLHWGRIVPIYSTTEGLGQKYLRELIYESLERLLPIVEDDLPEMLRIRLKLTTLQSAIRGLHFPLELPDFSAENSNELPPALYRLVFEEFFKYQLLQKRERLGQAQEKAPLLAIKNRSVALIRKNIPFELTGGQEQAIAEIRADIQKAQPMNRILQGDVGSGKTLVALCSLAEAVDNGKQGVLMVPTETLAEQHYKSAEKIFAGTGVRVVLLTGSLAAKEKRATQEEIRSGKAQLVIGTHAVIQDAVEWRDLALVVIDEQHRFGVRQRSVLKRVNARGEQPHLLTMTATPIPRSLALTIFGDLHVSSIRERPKNRLPIKTKALPGAERQKAYNLFHKEVRAGRQCYLIYPLVQDSEKEGMEKLKSVEAEYDRLSAGPLKGLRLGMIHGKLSSEERQDLMAAFARRELDVLIATTVIEVGIDVPNATVIAIENAERFGLSQLHQLRGRVGRGEHQSYCVLITDAPDRGDPLAPELKPANFYSDEAGDAPNPWLRLRVLENSQDGFEISEADLKQRGAGDFLGTKQSGAPSFRLANLVRDREIFELARSEAADLLERDPDLAAAENHGLAKFLARLENKLGYTLKSG